MPNFNPKTEHLKETQFGRDDAGKISEKVTGVRLPVAVHNALQTMSSSERAAWLRAAAQEKAEREGLLLGESLDPKRKEFSQVSTMVSGEVAMAIQKLEPKHRSAFFSDAIATKARHGGLM